MHHEAMQAALGKVFTIYAVFWVVVIAVLLIVIGPLSKRFDRGVGGHGHDSH
jgi:uncharacterized membrane protein